MSFLLWIVPSRALSKNCLAQPSLPLSLLKLSRATDVFSLSLLPLSSFQPHYFVAFSYLYLKVSGGIMITSDSTRVGGAQIDYS